MWAQLITARLKPGREGDVAKLMEEFKAVEQAGSGLVRSTAMQDQEDPSRLHILVVFEGEEQARARESDPKRNESLSVARALMAEVFDGPTEFVDLTVVGEYTG
jgi:antibiotic biosynthesis monooxygenase (ABM) superfamily enzyme